MVTVEKAADGVRVCVVGEFDFQTAREMLVLARERLRAVSGNNLIVQLRQVTRIESSGIGALILLAEMVPTGFSVETIDCAPDVHRFFSSGLMERYYPNPSRQRTVHPAP
ncbi:MAG: anti-sigma factor antagonist [Rhodocyclaceae bacterium]|nr:anti-sigma factor antagonist [Rhodocyclaceae bacterium]